MTSSDENLSNKVTEFRRLLLL